MSAAQPPVFVDDTGRRHRLTRRVGRIVVLGFTGYLGLVALGFARDPRVGPVHLPTFGLPSLGLVVPPAPTVLGAQATRTAEGQVESPLSTTTRPRSTASPSSVSPTAGRAGAPTAGSQASKTSTTTSPSTSTSTTSSTATTTTTTMPGQGQGQGLAQRSGAASTKGPDGSGPPGHERKTTTTTAG